jgi:signal transduction histidine kinase
VRDDLHRLVLNLLENAIRHTPPGTHVQASTGLEDGQVLLVVADDGPGIAPELERRVFERFVRGGREGARGSGLGLAIVRAVVESHGGTVTLGPTTPAGGTRFEIRIPASARQRQPAHD